MIKLIYGGKGSGKTTELLNGANSYALVAKGYLIYIDKNNARIHDLSRQIRLVDASDYGTFDQKQFASFIKGMTAVNYDIEKIYIDNLEKILKVKIDETKDLFIELQSISDKRGVEFVITVACEKELLPEFLNKYLI